MVWDSRYFTPSYFTEGYFTESQAALSAALNGTSSLVASLTNIGEDEPLRLGNLGWNPDAIQSNESYWPAVKPKPVDVQIADISGFIVAKSILKGTAERRKGTPKYDIIVKLVDKYAEEIEADDEEILMLMW